MAERTQRSNILLAFISLTAVIAVVSLIGFFTLGKGPEIIQGQAEADEYRVSGKVPARILELRVKEGDKVKAGDTLVILEAPDVMAKLSQAQAAEQAARAISEKAQRGTRREQLQAAFEMWQKAKAGVEIAEKSYNRVNRLFEQGVMSAQKRDEAKAQFDAMAATEKAARSQYEMAKNGARQEDKAAAAAQVERVQKAIIAALKDPAVKQRMAAQGLYPSGTSSADFTKQIASEVAKMKKLAAVANIHLD